MENNKTMLEGNETSSTRRTARQIKPSLKAMESIYISKLKHAGFVASVSSSDEDLSFSDEEFEKVCSEKPKLLHENEVVHGEEIFTFRKRKQKDSLMLKAAEAQKMPHSMRNKMQHKLKIIFEDSGSDYEASTESSESEELSEESNHSSDSLVLNNEQKKCKRTQEKIKFNDVHISKCKNVKSNSKYTINADEYFANCKSSKAKTSNNTLDKLETPRLLQYQLQTLLSNIKVHKEHRCALNKLSEVSKTHFEKWLYILNQNFNILLYGLGSKKSILSTFHKEHLQNMPVIVVNGFFPTLTIKNILDSIVIDLLELSESYSNYKEACDLILKKFSKIPENHLYLIIHNIDGESLRNGRAQAVLSQLATMENIHLIATIDHINAPLLWDHNKLSKFNFIWWDITSFLPYTEETSFEKSMLVQRSGNLALSSLRNIFLSLTQNSKAIYLKIAKYQTENSCQYYQGMAFKDLYMSCRESFIVSSDLALRAQLTEFLDHKMVKTKRSVEDGTEYLVIPIANEFLQKFLDENA